MDVALFELRLFKSRSQARAAIDAGAVLLNGAAVRPSHAVRPGDVLTLASAGQRGSWEVLALPTRSLSRSAARELLRARE